MATVPSVAGLHARYIVVRALAGVLLLALGYELWYALTNPLGVVHFWGADYAIYMDSARRFLAGHGFYTPAQFDPNAADPLTGTTVYPPIALLLFVPFSFAPPPVWWMVPVGTIVYVAWRQCKTDWQRVALIGSLVPFSLVPLASGNGSLWVAAALVAGNRWGWPAAFIVIKPTLGPLALVGIRTRGWWIVMAGLALVSLAILPMWFDWVRVISAFRGAPYYWPTIVSPAWPLLWLATLRLPESRRSTPERPG